MRYSFAIILFLAFSCRKKEDNNMVQIIGHGGMGLEIESSIFHDNTSEAVELAMSLEGCNGIELDVQLSEDNELWCYHDEGLGSETKSDGCISSSKYEDLKDVKYSTIQKEKLLRLSDLNSELMSNAVFFLDLRHYNACSSTVIDLELLVNQLIAFKTTLLSNQSLYLVTNNPGWVTQLVTSGFKVFFQIDEISGFDFVNTFSGLEGIVCRNSLITKSSVNEWQVKGLKVAIFDVRSPKGIRKAMNKKPDFIITDDVRATIIEKY